MTVFPWNHSVIILAGPTAIGKTALSIEIAQRFNCEIVGVDSMQIYKGMDIGTAKISESEMDGITHHLIDIVNPDEEYDAATFAEEAMLKIVEIHERGKTPLLTGGTGLYYKSLLEGLSENIPAYPEIRRELTEELAELGPDVMHEKMAACDSISAKRIHANDSQRLVRALEIFLGTGVPWSTWIEKHQANKCDKFSKVKGVCLSTERDRLYKRVNLRCTMMLDMGFEQEVLNLMEAGYNERHKPMNAIGYKHMMDKINGVYGTQEMTEKMSRDTRRYAKRQLTWFKKMDMLKDMDVRKPDEILREIDLFLEKNNQ